MSATAAGPVPGVMLTQGFAEPTIEVRDLDALERFYRDVRRLPLPAREDDRVCLAAGEHARLGLWPLEGNIVEVWDFFERGEGRRDGVVALAVGDVRRVDTSS